MSDAVEGIKQVARAAGKALGLDPSEEDVQDRLYLTRLANDPRHPMTPEMVDAVMTKSGPERHEMLVRWANEGMLPIDEKLTGWATSSSLSLAPNSSASMESGDWPPGRVRARGAELSKGIAPPYSEESSGAATSVGSTSSSSFGVESYLRLPLAAKRDAFVHDGFLYVRRGSLREWMAKLSVGKCCLPQREGRTSHASDCWVYLDGKG